MTSGTRWRTISARRRVRLAVTGSAVPSGMLMTTLSSDLLSSGSIFTVTHFV